MSINLDVLKHGFLDRKTYYLRRTKRGFYVLTFSSLFQFHREEDVEMKDRLLTAKSIRRAAREYKMVDIQQIRDGDSPEVFELVTRYTTITLQAENEEEMKEWKMVILGARGEAEERVENARGFSSHVGGVRTTPYGLVR